jgi:brefeldin A-inhibited guanine nucleotide-exchange protein
LNEIFIPILEMRHSTIRQKSLILGILIRLCHDPQALVEIYINYDCDRAAPENIYEKLMNIVSKIGQTHFAPPSKEELKQGEGSTKSKDSGPALPSSLSTAALAPENKAYANLSPEIKLRRQSLDCLVAALQGLSRWVMSNPNQPKHEDGSSVPRSSEDHVGRTLNGGSVSELPAPSPTWPAGSGHTNGANTPAEQDDDVARLEGQKQRKTTLQEGIKKFNFKPKRGVEFLLQNGFIRSSAPQDVARFLMYNEGLSKAMIGEYLGEG